MSLPATREERLMQILLAPLVSEKSTMVADKHNQIVFEVLKNATKPEIKGAVEMMFSTKDKKIEVVSVRTLNYDGKEKRFGRFVGRRRSWKKAYVQIKEGQEIVFAGLEAR